MVDGDGIYTGAGGDGFYAEENEGLAASDCDCEEFGGSHPNGCGGCCIPRYMKIVISGVTDCGTGECAGDFDVNGTFVADHVTSNSEHRWIYTDPSKIQIIFRYSSTFPANSISALAFGGVAYSNVCFLGRPPMCTCSGSEDNRREIGDCDCAGSAACGYDGTATYEPCDDLGNSCEGCHMCVLV